uniref:Uncharacterized protein n=1 Tax=Arundo donax TaxID=35708 RepID=A0A0A9AK41_ARUDO
MLSRFLHGSDPYSMRTSIQVLPVPQIAQISLYFSTGWVFDGTYYPCNQISLQDCIISSLVLQSCKQFIVVLVLYTITSGPNLKDNCIIYLFYLFVSRFINQFLILICQQTVAQCNRWLLAYSTNYWSHLSFVLTV